MEDLPKEIGWRGVSVSDLGGADTGVGADEEQDEVGSKDVGDAGEMGVLRWRGVAAMGFAFLLGLGR